MNREAQNYLVRERNINIFAFLLLVTILCTMGYNAYDLLPLQLLSYASECALIVYTFVVSSNSHNYDLKKAPVLLVSGIIILNYCFSPNEPEYTDLLKYLGYLGCYKFGDSLARKYDEIKVSKIWLYLIVFVPVFLVAFFDDSVMKNQFFRVSNGFVYLGVAIGGFYLLVKGRNKRNFIRAILITAFYILVCTSLGVAVAAFLTFLILNMKKNHIPYVIIGGGILLLAILFIDIPIFIRMRDVLTVWKYVMDNNAGNIQDVDFVEINNLDRAGERTDASSSVWRIVQWIRLFKEYVSEIWTIPFGMGAGYSVKSTGLYPHNDYLRILIEYGLIVFIYILNFVLSVYKRLKNEGMLIYFILTMLLYHLTENLLNNFPPGAILYFLIGWAMYKYRNIKYRINGKSLTEKNIER